MAFLTVNNFFCAFSKIQTERTFVHLFFLKVNQRRSMKHEDKFFLCLFFNIKKASCQFSQKNINIWVPWNFLKMKTLVRNLGIRLLKIIPDLWLLDLFCPIKKKFQTPPYCVLLCVVQYKNKNLPIT